MLGVLALNPHTGDFTADLVAHTGDRPATLTDAELAREFDFALAYQADRGGGVFWLNLPAR